MIVESLLLAIGVDPSKAVQGFQNLDKAATQADAKFNDLSQKWIGVFRGIAAQIAAPIAGAFAVGSVISSYMSDISSVATMTGAYSQKLEEWRIKRAMLSRVTKEDIELYKKGREAIVGFRISMADLSAKIMREAMPVMKFLIEGLNSFSKWCDRNGDNIVRFLKVTAAVLTTVFLPSLLKIGAAMLANPLTWIVLALLALIAVIDDLVVYMQGGESAMGGFWSMFGTGEEISAALSSALDAVKEVLKLLWKPLAAVAAGFAAFKTAGVAVQGFIGLISTLRKAMLLLAANPLLVMLIGIVSAVMWVKDAFDRAGGDWSKVLDIMGQDVIDFLNIFGGLGDKLKGLLGIIAGPFKAVGNIFANLFKVLQNGVKLLYAYFTGESSEVKEQLFSAFKDALSGLLSAVTSAFSSAFDAIVGLIGRGFELLANAWESLFNTITEKLGIALTWDDLKEAVSSVLSSIADAVSSFVDKVTGFFDSIVAFFGKLWVDILSSAMTFVIDLYQRFVSIKDYIAEAISAALTLVSELFNSFKLTVASIFADVAIAIGTAISNTLSFISDLFGSFKQTASDIFTQVSSAISSAIQSCLEVVSSVIDSIKSLFTELPETTQGVLSDLSSFFTNSFNAIVSFVTTQWTALTQGASDFVNQVVSFISSLPSTIADIFSQFVTIVTGAFSSAWQAALEFFNSIFDFLAAIPQKLLEAFDISALLGKAKDAVGDMFGSVKSFLGFGGDSEEQETPDTTAGTGKQESAEEKAAPPKGQAKVSAQSAALLPTDVLAQTQEALNQQTILREQMPANANSASYVTNNNQQSASNEVTQNITINAGAGTDPRALRSAVTQGVSDANSNTALVSTSDTGLMGI